MIYAKTTDDGLVIGLSERNIELLRAGHSIVKNIPGMPSLVIIAGETEAAIYSELAKHGCITVETRLIVEPRDGVAS